MRKLLIGLATGTAVIALPAQARDGAPYIGIEGGVATAPNVDFETADGTTVATADLDLGSDAGLLAGYDFGPVRAELDGSWKRFNLGALAGTVPVAGTYDEVAGKTDVWAGMANLLVDLGNEDALAFSVGGGAGFAKLDFKDITVDSTGPGFLDDSDTRFAWQAIAMVRAPFVNGIDVAVKYRYFNAPGASVTDNAGRTLDTGIKSHSILGTMLVNFGGRAAPTPTVPPKAAPPTVPPPPPPPPQIIPPPPSASCNAGPYIAFFDFDRSDITPEAATVLDQAVSAYNNCGRAFIMLAGHTDTSGSLSYNEDLAARRNASVRAYITGNGIPDDIISSRSFGESDPRVPTADGVREAQNRRVELIFGPGAGS